MPLRSEWSSSRGERTGRTKRDIESSEDAQKRVVLFGEGMLGDHLAMQVAIGLDPQWLPVDVWARGRRFRNSLERKQYGILRC
jgi:hypothetical protein